MKTLKIISAALLLTVSFNSFADDRLKEVKNSGVVSAPFVWGSPDSEIPVGLGFVKAKNAFVPVAPFTWGNPDEAVAIQEIPVAPSVWNDTDIDVPVRLAFIKAVNADVPVAPFVWGNAQEDAPQNLK